MFTGRKRIRKVALDGRYSVSDDGLVWSGDLPLEPIGGEGVNLHGKRVKIAYLVARAFVPNPECRKWVRHKDGDRTNNAASNLEWCDEEERGKRGRKPMVRWIKAWNLDGEKVGMYQNPSEASVDLNVNIRCIRNCLAGRQRTAGGYLWRCGAC